MKLSVIAAVASNNVIGMGNSIPWHLPEDLKRFRELTMGKHIIMGRKTFESLGRLLPGRTSVIITRNPDYRIEGALMADSLESALAQCQDEAEVFVIGGSEIYRTALEQADRLYLTRVDIAPEGDVLFPEMNLDMWQGEFDGGGTSVNGLTYRYLNLNRKPSFKPALAGERPPSTAGAHL